MIANPPSRAERRREKTRRDIANSALDLVERHGFNATIVEDIADGAGISVRTFYRYSNDKIDALAAELEQFPAALASCLVSADRHLALADATVLSIREAMAPDDVLVIRRRIIAVTLKEAQLRNRWLGAWRRTRLDITPVLNERLPGASLLQSAALAGGIVGAFVSAAELWAVAETGTLEERMADAVDVLRPALLAAEEAWAQIS